MNVFCGEVVEILILKQTLHTVNTVLWRAAVTNTWRYAWNKSELNMCDIFCQESDTIFELNDWYWLPVLHSLKSVKVHGVHSVPPNLPSPLHIASYHLVPIFHSLPYFSYLSVWAPPTVSADVLTLLRTHKQSRIKMCRAMELPYVGLHLCFIFLCIPQSSLRLIYRIGVVFAACCPYVDTFLIFTWACTRYVRFGGTFR
jgi:hypothetical protein